MATTRAPNARSPRQQSIPGTDVDDPEIAAAIEDWQDNEERKRSAVERATASNDGVTTLMIAKGVDYFPYVDRVSGKRKYRIVDRTARGRSVVNRAELPANAEADEPTLSENEPVASAPREEVTHRRVPRQEVEAELAAIAEETRRADDAGAIDTSAGLADGFRSTGRSPYAEDEDDADESASAPPAVEEIESDEPELDSLEQRTQLLEVELPASQVPACGLRYGKSGARCALPWKHEELHDNGETKWKQRNPRKPYVPRAERTESASDESEQSTGAGEE
jgi:hypothetical protein